MDMFDRFMDSRTGVRKEQLQLLGVTCLFIAAKIEVRIYVAEEKIHPFFCYVGNLPTKSCRVCLCD